MYTELLGFDIIIFNYEINLIIMANLSENVPGADNQQESISIYDGTFNSISQLKVLLENYTSNLSQRISVEQEKELEAIKLDADLLNEKLIRLKNSILERDKK